jgi:hypothetical protein
MTLLFINKVSDLRERMIQLLCWFRDPLLQFALLHRLRESFQFRCFMMEQCTNSIVSSEVVDKLVRRRPVISAKHLIRLLETNAWLRSCILKAILQQPTSLNICFFAFLTIYFFKVWIHLNQFWYLKYQQGILINNYWRQL